MEKREMTWKAVLETSEMKLDRLYLFCRAFKGKAQYVKPFVMQERTEGQEIEPTMFDTYENIQDGYPGVRDFMQAILDEAWSHGMRPKSFEEHTNELKAVRYHLEDMRKLTKVDR